MSREHYKRTVAALRLADGWVAQCTVGMQLIRQPPPSAYAAYIAQPTALATP